MDGINAFLAIVIGLVLRLGLPIAGTVLVVYLLQKLDRRWQVQAEAATARALEVPAGQHCWERHNCAIETRQTCPAFLHPEQPCWQVHRGANGDLLSRCLACELFAQAGVPVPASAAARVEK
jgi:hypothetical protein